MNITDMVSRWLFWLYLDTGNIFEPVSLFKMQKYENYEKCSLNIVFQDTYI